MKSMTGYGRAEKRDEVFEIDCEIKSVNSRFLDLKISAPREFSYLENNIRDLISARINRGKVDIRLNFLDKREPKLVLNESKLKLYGDIYTRARDILAPGQEIPLAKIVAEKDVIRVQEDNITTVEPAVEQVIKEALAAHQAMAIKEGKTMQNYLSVSLQECENSLLIIEKSFPDHKESILIRMLDNIKNLLDIELDDENIKRIAMEAAIYNEKADVTEEIVRMKSHIKQLKTILASGTSDPLGKKLNFIVQEMQREINTIGSKFNTPSIMKEIIIIKEEIEKCRELIQNIE